MLQKIVKLQKEGLNAGRNLTVRTLITRFNALDGFEVLLLRRSSKQSLAGHDEPPGGQVGYNESVEIAAIREIFEETGINFQGSISFIGYLDFTTTKNILIREFFFLGVCQDSLNVYLSPNEHESYHWHLLTDISSSNLHPVIKEYLRSNIPVILKLLNGTKKDGK